LRELEEYIQHVREDFGDPREIERVKNEQQKEFAMDKMNEDLA
jgi:hypothetical protein